jgi:uncharacterized membrane protein YeaQ/YmgE (transglycosylase-associated protein family)
VEQQAGSANRKIEIVSTLVLSPIPTDPIFCYSQPALFPQIFQIRISGEKIMSILAWIVLGLVAGFIGSKIVNKSGEGLILDIVLGVVGAIVGGWLFSFFGARGVTGLNIYSLVVAVIGAMVVLFVYHAIKKA